MGQSEDVEFRRAEFSVLGTNTVPQTVESLALDNERSIWQIIIGALALYWRYPFLFVALAFAVIAPYELFVLVVTGVGPLAYDTHRTFETTVLIDLVDFSLAGPLISALHVHAVILAGEGRTPEFAVVTRRGLHVLPVVVAAEIVANAGIWVGLLALVVPGLVLLLRWAVVAQAAAVDHEGWIDALRRSWRLTSGNAWRVLGLFVISGGLGFVLHVAAAAVPLGNTSDVVSVAFGIAVDTVIASLSALIFAFLYFDLCAREVNPRRRSIPEYQHVHDLE